jgi:mannose-6-phosphate isomerase-like protein (cupin superfamily)
MRLRMLISVAGLLVAAGWATRPEHSGDAGSKPLILEKNEGENRVRRPRGTQIAGLSFIIKVDRKNGGSQQMWLGTEEMKPGAQIPRHQHLGQDEILILETGTAHVWLGDQESDLHAGGIVYIPSETWISLKNTGNEPILLAFVFSAPGFDDYLRCSSTVEGERSTSMTKEELAVCAEKGHVHYASRPQTRPQ